MENSKTIWLVRNDASGSNADETLDALVAAFTASGIEIAHTIAFPDDPLPDPAALDAAGIETLAVFAGDGTVNTLVRQLAGWQGQVLVLPGGTMNLLANLLHGPAEAGEIVARFAEGRARRVRTPVIRSQHGDALAGVLAGPGTAWNDVREAMRQGDVIAMTGSTAAAIGESRSGPMVFCREPPVGRDAGYSLLVLTPAEAGIVVEGYYAETLADYARQGLALLARNFRDGPHDDLGIFAAVTAGTADEGAMGLLIDGEPAEGEKLERLISGRSKVEFVATVDAGG